MKNVEHFALIAILSLGLLSSVYATTPVHEFSHPKVGKTTITMEAGGFKDFDAKRRGTDYYYYGETPDRLICSILFFKLNEEEILTFITAPRALLKSPEKSPIYPLTYFSTFSKLKEYEKNDDRWGLVTDDFMFRQNDITEFQGAKTRQKHMYGYCMPEKNLFVSIHLSKDDYAPADSTAMMKILKSLILHK